LKKKELIFIAGILILAGVLWLGFQIAGKRSHNTIRITVDGKEFGTYSLSQDQTSETPMSARSKMEKLQ
jgi:hypothetical protein